MKNLLLLCLLTLAVSGCTATKVDRWEIEVAQKACAEHGGVDFLDTWQQYRCNDGTSGDSRVQQ